MTYRRRVGSALLALLLVPSFLVGQPAQAEEVLPFRNPDLPLEVRLNDLTGRLTLDEKISLLHQYQPAIPRLGIASFKTGTEALHGVAWSNDIDQNSAVVAADGTSFAQPPGLASTWNPELIKQVG